LVAFDLSWERKSAGVGRGTGEVARAGKESFAVPSSGTSPFRFEKFVGFVFADSLDRTGMNMEKSIPVLVTFTGESGRDEYDGVTLLVTKLRKNRNHI